MFKHTLFPLSNRLPARAGLAAAMASLALAAAIPQHALAQPAAASGQPATASGPASGAQAGAGAMDAPALQTRLGREKAAMIESHITRLHRALRITASQQPLWRAFTAAMRQNVAQMDAAYARRQANGGDMTAVQELESYGEVEQTNAQNVQQLLPPFRALYDSFSPDQKKTADAAFQRYTDHAVKRPG